MSSANAISKGGLELLLRLMSTPKQEADLEYLSSVAEFGEVLRARLVYPVQSPVESICIDGLDYDLVADQEGPGYRYFSPVLGWVDADAASIKKYKVNVVAFLRCLQGLLDISAHQNATELFPGGIWDLGDTWVGKSRTAILFCRRARLSQTVYNLKSVLTSFPRRRSAIVLTDNAMSQHGPSLPGEPLCLRFMDVLLPDQQLISAIDKSLFAELLGQGVAPHINKPPVWCADDGSELVVYEKSYVFNGLNQKRIIRQLFDAWQSGEIKLRTAAVLENAESKSKTLSQALGKKVPWREVVSHGDGYCWLELETV